MQFQNPFFSAIEGGYFRMSEHTRQPVFVLNYGGMDAALSIPGIRHELGIEADSQDGRMLDLVARGLKFVSALRIGDPVPTEVTTGEASWEISERHHDIARHRITMQLITWMGGSERLVTDAEELLQIAEDPATKKKIEEATAEAAERLGLGRDRRKEVLDHLEDVAGELAYLEALRELFHEIEMVQAKVQRLRRIYGKESGMFHLADPVARLIVRAVASYRETFEEIDAQTGEIMSVLKNIGAQKQFIRDKRDELHCKLSAWKAVLEKWSGRGLGKTDGDIGVMTDTYQFLAPRFMVAQEWVLSGALQPVANLAETNGTEDVRSSGRFAHSMRW